MLTILRNHCSIITNTNERILISTEINREIKASDLTLSDAKFLITTFKGSRTAITLKNNMCININ